MGRNNLTTSKKYNIRYHMTQSNSNMMVIHYMGIFILLPGSIPAHFSQMKYFCPKANYQRRACQYDWIVSTQQASRPLRANSLQD